ncbi:MAG: AraC family transcriptional regulator [Sphingomonas sp.]|nr:AraC family transcriptional regulator [Sphingomonas sp.]
MDGRHSYGRNAPDTLIAIAAGAGGQSSWDASFDAACFYFSDAGLAAVTDDGGNVPHIMLGVSAEFRAPDIVRLLHALRHDAEVGQPHGKLIGDAIFIAIAAMLVDGRRRAALRISSTGTDWRVGRALAYIHAHPAESLSIDRIAHAATTSPFHLHALFRAVLGLSIWRYVLRERARYASVLMLDPNLTLAMIAQLSGFDSYAGFIASIRREYGMTPAVLRAEM